MMVFCSNITTVIGSTPPGTGVINDAFFDYIIIVCISDQFAFKSGNCHVDDDCAFFHHVWRENEPVQVTHDGDDVCISTYTINIGSFGVACSNGGVAVKSNK